ncbi:MAG: thioredoxin fold domain-containing protein [Armatimonadetes bacterium]|nr:thioredoxin fold domain-containing protein [Armatimonadota bacterium]
MALTACFTAGYSQGVQWRTDFTKAQAESKRTGKLIVVDFFSDNCVACVRLDKYTFPDSTVARSLTGFIPAKINADHEGKQLAKRYEVTGFPNIVFIRANGKMVGRIVGYMGPDMFNRKLAQIKTIDSNLPKWQAAFRQNHADIHALVGLGLASTFQGNAYEAEKYLSLAESKPSKGQGNVADLYIAVGDIYRDTDGGQAKGIALYKKALATATERSQGVYSRLMLTYLYAMSKDGKPLAQEQASFLSKMKLGEADQVMLSMLQQMLSQQP